RRRQLCYREADETETDNRNGVPGADSGSLDDVEGTTERLQRGHGKGFRQQNDTVGIHNDGAGIRAIGNDCYPPPQEVLVDPGSSRLDSAPALVPERARCQRVIEPGAARPGRQIGRAYTAALEDHPDLAIRGRGPYDLYQLEAPGRNELRGGHHAHLG